MLPPADQDWRLRRPPTDESDATAPEATDSDGRAAAVAERSSTAAADRHGCPVCGFASVDADDVYAHLMTAHRKSTISAALLGR